jgi:GT2 family glycosyltransferase
MQVSVIIVNRNGSELLDDCLGSLTQQTYRDFELIFVDNGSTDDSLDKVRRLMPAARIVASAVNLGFAAGNNAGIRQASGKYIVLLNNDTRAEPQFLEELLAVADRDPGTGMVAPKILNFFQPDQIDSVGGLLLCPDGIGQGRGRGECDVGQFDDLDEILIPSGCAALYRRDMLDEIGLFDERFFLYCEDSDLGLRSRWAGWRARSAPRAVVYHKYSASTSAYSPLKLFYVERNHFLLALRNFPARLWLQLPVWTLYRYVLMALALLRGAGKGQAGPSGRLWIAFLQAHVSACWLGPGYLLRRPSPRRITAAAFAQLVRQHRLSIRKMILDA